MLFKGIFDSIHSPASLSMAMRLSDLSVERQLRRARLTIPERNWLYPSPGVYGKSSDFDISLTSRLLRTICKLSPPPPGSDSLPNDLDFSLEADLARIKNYRNNVLHNSKESSETPDDHFLDLWEKISELLLKIAANVSPEQRSNWKGAMRNSCTSL